MTNPSETGNCANVPEGCDCSPKQYLTCQEEAVLKQLKDVKEQARSVMDQMKEFTSDSNFPADAEKSKVRYLSERLDELRNRWSELEVKLDEAIEEKLVRLGHREPHEENVSGARNV